MESPLFLWQETHADDLFSAVKRLLPTQPGWEGVTSWHTQPFLTSMFCNVSKAL